MSESATTFQHTPLVPMDRERVGLYINTMYPYAMPYEYNGFRAETDSWKKSAYIGANLSTSPTYRLTGPDVIRFLEDHLTNRFDNFQVGRGKHGIIVDDEGLIVIDGVLMRLSEDEVRAYWLSPYLDYLVHRDGKDYDITGENISGKVYFYQIGGPRSLEILERAAGADLHDIRFMGHREAVIAGKTVRILRMGMAGSLAYEVHGEFDEGLPVYEAIYAAGQDFGIERLGARAYLMNHTENGYPQAYYHFTNSTGSDPRYLEWVKTQRAHGLSSRYMGSARDDVPARYRNPIELGWGKMIDFTRPFPGREALDRIAADPKRTTKTLVWNTDDLVEIYRSQFEQGEPYLAIDHPNHYTGGFGGHEMWQDYVLNEAGERIGISSGRCYTYYFRDMISLATLDLEYAEEGTQVFVLWGLPGQRQMRIRATVARMPYLQEGRNQTFDVESIPRLVNA